MTGKGYVLKVSNNTFPNELLAEYANVPDRRQDKNSYTDGRGVTHRNILPVKRTTIKIKTIDELTFEQKKIIQAFFPNRDKIVCEVWNDERNEYQTITSYVPDITYKIKRIDKEGNFYYEGIEFELIDYGSEKQ